MFFQRSTLEITPCSRQESRARRRFPEFARNEDLHAVRVRRTKRRCRARGFVSPPSLARQAIQKRNHSLFVSRHVPSDERASLGVRIIVDARRASSRSSKRIAPSRRRDGVNRRVERASASRLLFSTRSRRAPRHDARFDRHSDAL